jgi:hypothetical protein
VQKAFCYRRGAEGAEDFLSVVIVRVFAGSISSAVFPYDMLDYIHAEFRLNLPN